MKFLLGGLVRIHGDTSSLLQEDTHRVSEKVRMKELIVKRVRRDSY